jgi:UDP-N-acetylglucosamine--N-acetylmuramyl-(pentapeptide) pyrophosphoryl-undecaprenol N-acetylglucosamine transferase
MIAIAGKREQAFAYFKLNPAKKTVLVIGGSLGARTLNTSIEQHLQEFVMQDVQLIWQTGRFGYAGIIERLGVSVHPNIAVHEFIKEMDLAYAAADIIVSRAGAGTIAELCLVQKPVILVPSPNVAEDHQTKNAVALVNQNAALLVTDAQASEMLVSSVFSLLNDSDKQDTLSENIHKLAFANADMQIAQEVLKLVNR